MKTTINILRKIVWSIWIEDIILLFIISLTFYSQMHISVAYNDSKPINISHQSNAKIIISQLNTRGYNLTLIDEILLMQAGDIKQGEIRLRKKRYNRIDFLYMLTQARDPLIPITLIPGETSAIFLNMVAKKIDINETKLHNALTREAKYKEASIAPDTYLIPKKMNEDNLIRFLLRSSEKHYKELSHRAYGEYNKSKWNKILTVASIVQKEAANIKEMPLVASVIYNRLEKNMRLQMDGTLNYGKYSHIKVTPKRIKTDTSLFNTYKHKGLPPSPIGSVSSSAILAAITPSKTSYLFFMRNKNGVHDFTTTFKAHRKNIEKVK